MKIHTKTDDLPIEKHSVVTIGTFDGVHLGHKTILTKIREISAQNDLETLVFTFEPHPRTILFPEQKDLKLLNTRFEKRKLIEACGIDHLLEFPFTKEFASIDPVTYVKDILVNRLRMKKIVIGYDHRFGKNREGSIHLLKELGSSLSFGVEEIPAKDIDDINISSTRIRKALEEGEIKKANSFLGYSYFMTGMVVEGKKLGRELGYPTANLNLNNSMKLIPKMGVYAVEVKVSETGMCYKGMMNIGTNPTTDKDNNIKIEVNLFDFKGDLYNKELCVSVEEYIRPELKFNGLEELKNAIAEDKEKAIKILTT